MPADRPGRSSYVHWRSATLRWADIDVYGHMNNARYFEVIDTVVNDHLAEALGGAVPDQDVIGVVAEVSCRFFAEVTYPGSLDLGIVVDRIGNSSIVYRVGIFQGDPATDGSLARAEGRFVHVYVDNRDPSRPVAPLPADVRAAVEPLLLSHADRPD